MIAKGKYEKNGCGHFSKYRPKFYAEVERQTGIRLQRGTLNIRCEPDVFGAIPEPVMRIDGVDEIDMNANQDLLIAPCSIKGVKVIGFCQSFGQT